ncbi:MAG: hypothetical protein RLZZ480_19 [Candidatus Parcubacteria bacterium]|jgi:hypothetical protein
MEPPTGICTRCKKEVPVEHVNEWDTSTPDDENYITTLHPRTEPDTELFCYGSNELSVSGSLKF